MTSPQHLTSPTARPCITKVRVPGKVILSGEHAVVYGTKALACAIQCYAYAHVQDTAKAGFRLTIADFLIDQHYTPSQLQQLALATQTRHQAFIQSRLPLEQVVANPADFFAAALGASEAIDQIKPNHGLHIDLTTDLVVGGGMGSSAALVAAMLAAVFKHLEEPLSKSRLIAKTTQSEHWQHGKSSGLDPFVCINGGLQEYQLGQGQDCNLGGISHSYLVSTGRPQSSTGECVEAVKKRAVDTDVWQQFAQVEAVLLQALDQSSAADLISAVMHNQRLLEQIGVVPTAVAEFIQQVEQCGGAAKICGAGSVAGDQGGLVWVVGIDCKAMVQLAQNSGYTYQPMVPDLEGVQDIE